MATTWEQHRPPPDFENEALDPLCFVGRYTQWRGRSGDFGHQPGTHEEVTWCGVRYRYHGYRYWRKEKADGFWEWVTHHYYMKELLTGVELKRARGEVRHNSEEPGVIMVVKEKWESDELVSFPTAMFGYWPWNCSFEMQG